MKRISITVAGVAIVGIVAAAFVYLSPAVQDTLVRRIAANVMGAAPLEPIDGMRVIVCGSASPLGNDPTRAQACIAVITPEHFLLFDVGARSPLRIAAARMPTGRLTGVFLTHFHSDHIAALPDVNLNSWVQGRRQSLEVFGPPGVERVVSGFNEAYGPDSGYRTAHHGSDLLPPAAGPMTARVFAPGEVAWQDDLLTVTSIPVNHSPVSPAVGYRVDYRGRSVVISGDTVAVDALFTAAQGADLLLHDALSRELLDPMIETATALGVPRIPKIMTDVIDYHADATTLEERARAAGIRQLALYHLVPVPINALAERIFARGLSSDTLLVRDLHTFDLPAGSEEVRISAPQ